MSRAERLARAAYAHVPESADTEALAAYFDGAVRLRDDRCAEALPFLQKANARLPEIFGTQPMIFHAHIGVAFDKKDYDAFLSFSTQASAKWPKDVVWKASIASAQACKFAATGNPMFREQATASLKEAKALAPADDPGLADYEKRILHRLATRDIIARNEFNRRFPNGWQGKKETSL